MKLSLPFILLFGLSFGFAAAQGAPITFKDHGKEVRQTDSQDLGEIVHPTEVKVWDANEEDEVTYEAYPAAELFDRVFGKDWAKSEEVLFTCADGYQPSLPADRFTKYKAYLAFKRAGTDSFSITNKHEHGKKVDVGPLYLVWAGANAGELNSDDAAAWPYQVVSVDLQTFKDVFPRLAPPEKSTVAAKRGFVAFRGNCLGCHTLNGDGGSGGPELNYPVNITEYYKEDWLKKWILDPTSIRFKTGMPGLRKDLPDREKLASDIIAYFKAMKNNKTAPKK